MACEWITAHCLTGGPTHASVEQAADTDNVAHQQHEQRKRLDAIVAIVA